VVVSNVTLIALKVVTLSLNTEHVTLTVSRFTLKREAPVASSTFSLTPLTASADAFWAAPFSVVALSVASFCVKVFSRPVFWFSRSVTFTAAVVVIGGKVTVTV